MKAIVRLILILILFSFMPACDGVIADKPFGSKPTILNEEDWNGYWYIDDDEIFNVRVVNAEEGILEVGAIDDSDGGMIIEKSRMYLRESGDWKFIFLQGDNAEAGYTWYKYENYEGEMLMLWMPSADRFEEAVEQGLLSGEVKEHNVEAKEGDPFKRVKYTTVILTDIGPEEIELIKSEDQGIYFDWKHPIPLFKFKR